MKAKGAPIQVGRTVFDGAVMEVDVFHGKPLALQLAHERLLDEYRNPEREAEREERLAVIRKEYKDNLTEKDKHVKQIQEEYKDLELTAEQRIEREDRAKRLILAGMIPNTFSYEGSNPELYPIEDIDELLLNALWTAHLDVNMRIDDDWVQVQVRRAVPIEVKLMLQNTFEVFPLGKGEKVAEMAEDALESFLERSDAQRNVLVSSMIMKPALSLNGNGAKNAYPIENLSEQMLQCLFSAYSVVNTPSEGLNMLRMFPRRSTNRVG